MLFIFKSGLFECPIRAMIVMLLISLAIIISFLTTRFRICLIV